MISEEKLYEFCKDHYYCDPDPTDGERSLWEPFEYNNKDLVEEYIQHEVNALKKFLERNLNVEWDSKNNN